MNPIKPKLKTEMIPLVLVVLSFFASFYFYSRFPEQVPIHWNFKGEVDNYGSKMFAAFFYPILLLGMYLFFLGLPYLDPKKEKYDQFRKVYHVFKNVIISIFVLIYFVTSFHVLGYGPSPQNFIPFVVGALFVVLGNYLPKIKTNWFLGIRTPWTLSSELAWQKTHQLGGKLFIASGVLFLLIPLLSSEKAKMLVFLIAVTATVLGPIVYSFFIFKKEKKQDNEKYENN